MSKTIFYQRTSFLYCVAIMASALLSFWINVREAVINPDAVCYLYSAEAVSTLGLRAAMHLCPQAIWPFYSVLIFAFVKLIHLPYDTAAFVLDGVFTALSVVAFIAIIKELGGSRRVLWLSAIVILLSHEFNILRQDIIRDHGFWAFYLVSLFFLLRYFRQPIWQSAFAWCASLLIATLFRIEGAIFLLGLPFISWCCWQQTWQQRAKLFLILNTPLLIIMTIMTGWLFIHPQQTFAQLGRVSEVGNQLQHGFALVLNKYEVTKVAVSKNVLTHVSLRDANIVVFLLLVSWYIVNVIGNISWIYAVLVGYAWVSRAARFSRSGLLVLSGYLIVNLMVTFVFFAENHFLAKRYLIAFSLVLMLWVPFALDKLLQFQDAKLPKQRLFATLAMLFIFISAGGGIFHFGHLKGHVRQAGDWLAVHVPSDAKLYTNDYQLMYYSQHFGNGIFQEFEKYKDIHVIAKNQWRQYDYLALRVSNNIEDKTPLLMQEIHLAPMQVFVSHDGDRVYIYKTSQLEKKS